MNLLVTAGNTLVEINAEMDHVRMVKTPEEIRRLHRACDITIKAHESFRAAIRQRSLGTRRAALVLLPLKISSVPASAKLAITGVS